MSSTTAEKKSKAGSTKAKGKKKAGAEVQETVNGQYVFRESQRKIITMDVRSIVSSLGDNHRYPLSDAMYEAGYGLFEPLPGHPELLPLWDLATSDDPAKRAEFIRVMNLYEGTNPADPTCIDLATSIHGGCKGQMYQVFVKENAPKKNSGQRTFICVAGHRRVIAILYLWCNGLRKEPLCEAELVKGNTLDLRALQKDENAQRKRVTAITVAQGYQRSLNEGASLEQVADANGVSVPTVQRWLSFLELEPREQDKLNSGKLRHDDAIAIVEDRRKGGKGQTPDGLSAEEAAEARPAKGGKRRRVAGKKPSAKIEAAYNDPPKSKKLTSEQWKIALGWVLGKNDENGTAITAMSSEEESNGESGTAGGDFTAVLPPEGAAVGLMDDVELEVDENGEIVASK